MNTIEFLQISSAVVPDREALVEVGGTTNKRITYEEMYPLVVKLANALQGLGISQGQKVATMAQKVDRRMGACFGGSSVPRPSAPSSDEVIAAAQSAL